ncbi:uncharacterized protein AFUA_1G02220 [Aspergillus fumigatus Af293]|uniref:Uncharacterized protein n=1 Tax=Aspergillus fumigatus (strain ATCC MYA-4609 / CBS 101355 / FGSC A1100 / Af293) TaxID=330879 RepID=Q4WKJ8_ASPFU|nr:hypothetical protein AFUA_1G02220 [Aspergillus fumigatus Af293]EAL87934.1 hypothetical protein AFUA_1G02220 [Aspergillus fumigatus Af293]
MHANVTSGIRPYNLNMSILYALQKMKVADLKVKPGSSGANLICNCSPPGCSDSFLRGDERYEKHATSRLLPGSEELCVDGKLLLVCQEDAGDEFPTNVKIVSA